MPNHNPALVILALMLPCVPPAAAEPAAKPVGTQGPVGTPANPKVVNRLEITKPGVYENYLIDAQGAGGNIVKITADHVTLRHCEIRNATGNAVGIFGDNVTIESCRIHHLLNSTFEKQHDAHGITGRWGRVTIRNCDISHMSGDCIQFDPDRDSQGEVLIEDCHLWTGPLPADALGFKKGQRPGENAVDTKTRPDGERCKLVIRNCYMHGFNQPAQIDNAAALNLKENIQATVDRCVLADNQIALRVRGPGKRGGAHVLITRCAIYQSDTGVRAEDEIQMLKIDSLAFGQGVGEKIRFVGGSSPGFENKGEQKAPPLQSLLKNGFSSP